MPRSAKYPVPAYLLRHRFITGTLFKLEEMTTHMLVVWAHEATFALISSCGHPDQDVVPVLRAMLPSHEPYAADDLSQNGL